MANNVLWSPQPKQIAFMRRGEYEGLYGGAAGGGKSDALVAEALRQVGIPHYKALILRKTFPQLSELIDKSLALYPKAFPGPSTTPVPTPGPFPAGPRFASGPCSTPRTGAVPGHAYDFIAFDELTHFTWDEYSYLFSRNRPNGPGTRVYMRSTANPGGIGHGGSRSGSLPPGRPRKPSGRAFRSAFPDGHTERRFSEPGMRPGVAVRQQKAVGERPILHRQSVADGPGGAGRYLYGNWDSFEGRLTVWRNDPGPVT